MLVSKFDFELPENLIAMVPPENRDAGRMLVVDSGNVSDNFVKNFVDFLKPGDVVVFNNSRVIPCRFNAGEYEFTLHTQSGDYWLAFAKKFNKLEIGERLQLNDGTEIKIMDKDTDSGVMIKFHTDNVFDVLERNGKIPLPPYIKRTSNEMDKTRYQTVYANPPGSMAAPTAGLHFTDDAIKKIKEKAVVVNITLHVGSGTWLPVKSKDTKDHKMHAEFGIITPAQMDIINNAKRVIAVGTTTLRLLESANGKPFSGKTDIFITPGYKFKTVDVLLTNFHLPKSTLFMLVCAFAGMDEMRAAYNHAILEKYRFFSYGDCCLLFKKEW